MPKIFLLVTLTALLLSACAEPGRYPVSGAECDPDDPVQGLDASDCIPPVSGT